MNTCIISTFRLLWVMMIWTLLYKNLFKCLLLNLSSIHLEVDLLNHMVIYSQLFQELSSYFPQWLYHFALPSACTRVPISPNPHQQLFFSIFKLVVSESFKTSLQSGSLHKPSKLFLSRLPMALPSLKLVSGLFPALFFWTHNWLRHGCSYVPPHSFAWTLKTPSSPSFPPVSQAIPFLSPFLVPLHHSFL